MKNEIKLVEGDKLVLGIENDFKAGKSYPVEVTVHYSDNLVVSRTFTAKVIKPVTRKEG